MKESIDLGSMIYKEPSNLNPQKGDLLVAEPMLSEPYFKRSAVLILEENKESGHIGLTMNVRTPVNMRDLFPDWVQGEHIPLYSGGPVDADRLFMIHSLGNEVGASLEIAPGLYVGAKLDKIVEYINDGNDAEGKIRFFLGYSGWAKGQLVTELLRNSWALNSNPDTRDILMGAGEEYWRREVEKLGQKYRSWLLIPSNPSFN